MGVLPAHMSVHKMHVWYPWGTESVRLSVAGVTDDCGPLCVCWEPNPGPLKEQQVLLTTEPSPEPHQFLLNQ